MNKKLFLGMFAQLVCCWQHRVRNDELDVVQSRK